MKINELAKQSGVNAETIRKYRDRGLLHPKRNEKNGYYEYTLTDFLNLLYIRKLRGANLPLDAIAVTCRNGDAASILDGYRRTIQTLEEQICELKRREMMLRVTARHYERDAEAYGKIRLIQAYDVKYDSYFSAKEPDDVQKIWIRNIQLFTVVICIRRDWFEAEELPERIPVCIGIGTYHSVLEEEQMPIPDSVQVFPKGQYACFFLDVDDLYSVPGERLMPIRKFLREQRLKPQMDSTAYLYRVDTAGSRPRFIFCVRVLVKQENEE